MIESLGLAFAVVMGVRLPGLLLLAGATFWPVPMLALVAVLRARFRIDPPGPVAFCDGIATELRAGASIRSAISASALSSGLGDLSEEATSGASVAGLARSVRSAFPGVGAELELAITEVASSGSGGADLFDEVGTLALAQQEVAREVRVAAAPAKATAGLFVFGPAVYMAMQARSGSLTALLANPGQQAAAAAGLVLFALGLTAAALVMWKSR